MARGEQIYTLREFLNIDGVYEHHGIDCGDGTVIHYRKGKETIERTSKEYFTDRRKVYVKRYPVRYIADTVIQRAESRLGERKYNIVFNNCEHFATWCITGVSHSQQVKNFIPLLYHINVEQISEPIKQAILGVKTDLDTAKLVNKALADIKIAWENIQPEYKQLKQEINTWQKVAVAAMKQDREDLARAALMRKQKHQQRADELEASLQKLATMTETLLRSQDLIGKS
ncbi:MAG: NC domain-containing protein [Okeania sp. SIO3H1]|uniref:lecithin retinol acyltransferase family protein n=1 Tax=Okeania sp. SIO1I7 TaxID=2607772 RepID=UPI0013CAFC78|nr:lecithin retinol acyltransferase family protein [Okeania sp. SIO1I7]NEN88940.1 NC domain-containing protein [Okeania sp. SIO3H1]NET25132.1 NC domain-containing protein [Okeania sp. SIO1I7]